MGKWEIKYTRGFFNEKYTHGVKFQSMGMELEYVIWKELFFNLIMQSIIFF